MSIGMLVLALLLSAESEKETDWDNEAVRHEKAAALMKMGVEFRRQENTRRPCADSSLRTNSRRADRPWCKLVWLSSLCNAGSLPRNT